MFSSLHSELYIIHNPEKTIYFYEHNGMILYMPVRDSNTFRVRKFEKLCDKLSIEFFYANNSNRDVSLIVSGGDRFSLLEQYSVELFDIVEQNKKILNPKYSKLLSFAKKISEGQHPIICFRFVNKISSSKLDLARKSLENELENLNRYKCENTLKQISRLNKSYFQNVCLDALVYSSIKGNDVLFLLTEDKRELSEEEIVKFSESIYCVVDYDMSKIASGNLSKELLLFILMKIEEELHLSKFELDV